MKFIILIFFQ